MSIQEQIEAYLLERNDWVPAQEICFRFGVRERQLRQLDDMPGLCTGFAVSGKLGFKHVSKATTSEYLEFKHRQRKHAIRELCRVRDLDRRRNQVTRPACGVVWERDTPQAVMAI